MSINTVQPPKRIVSSDVIRSDPSISTAGQQKDFFLLNLVEQFRAYYISKDSSSTSPYSEWYSENSTAPVSEKIRIHPDYVNSQKEFFQLNLIEQFRAYYISKDSSSTSHYSSIPTDVQLLVGLWNSLLGSNYTYTELGNTDYDVLVTMTNGWKLLLNKPNLDVSSYVDSADIPASVTKQEEIWTFLLEV